MSIESTGGVPNFPENSNVGKSSPIKGVQSLKVIPAEPEVTSLLNASSGSTRSVKIESVKVAGQQS